MDAKSIIAFLEGLVRLTEAACGVTQNLLRICGGWVPSSSYPVCQMYKEGDSRPNLHLPVLSGSAFRNLWAEGSREFRRGGAACGRASLPQKAIPEIPAAEQQIALNTPSAGLQRLL